MTSALMWFRRDLRLADNAALAAARAGHARVYCVFVFDRSILDPLRDPAQPFANPADRRVAFIHASLAELDAQLRAHGGALIVRHAVAADEIPRLAQALGVAAVYANRDVEPAALDRDARVAQALAAQGRAWVACKDQVVFERQEVRTAAGGDYTVFTPYKNAWLKRLRPDDLAPHASLAGAPFAAAPALPAPALPASALPASDSSADPRALDAPMPSLAALGFTALDPSGRALAADLHPGETGAAELLAAFLPRLSRYAAERDFPALNGTSGLSVALRFGTVSIRSLVRLAHAAMLRGDHGAEVWLAELIWREFFSQILAQRPDVTTHAFRREYDAIVWHTGAQADAWFEAWRTGQTGVPIVDAAMRELAATGAMHNRLRMICASFLVKDLGLDWRRGEAWFAARLNDFDLASNNGGWQWSASTGCDAQPYFRIFNPTSQSRKFDPDGKYLRRWLPELSALDDGAIHAPGADPIGAAAAGVSLGHDYPWPVVDHDAARRATLARFEAARAAAGRPEPRPR